MITFFKHVFSILIGVGSKPEEFKVTPIRILVMAMAVGVAFLGSISLLMISMKLILG